MTKYDEKISPYNVSVSDLLASIEYDAYYDLYPGYYYSKENDPENENKEFYFNSKEDAIDAIENVFYQFDILPDPIPIYRVIKVQSLDKIDKENLGVSWSFSKDSALGFGDRYNVKSVLLTGKIAKKHVNWRDTLKLYVQHSLDYYGEEENEIVVPDSDHIEDLEIIPLSKKLKENHNIVFIENKMTNNHIILTEQQLFLIEDRKQFKQLVEKRKNNGKPVSDEDISNIESISDLNGYLGLFAKLYFNEIDNGISGYTAKMVIRNIANVLKEHPNIANLLPKHIFQYSEYQELRSDLREAVKKISANLFFKKLPTKLKDKDKFQEEYDRIANLYLQVKTKDVEKIVLKKSARFYDLSDFLNFVEKILDNLIDFDELKNQFQGDHVDLIYENRESQLLLFVAKDEHGFDILTNNSPWCISLDYGDECVKYRNEYSKQGSHTFCKLYNLAAEDSNHQYFGFFIDEGELTNCYDAGDSEAKSTCLEIIEENNIDLSKIPNYTYYFENEDDYEEEDDYDYEEEEEEEFDPRAVQMSFVQLAYLMKRKFGVNFINVNWGPDSKYFTAHNTPRYVSNEGEKFVNILNKNVYHSTEQASDTEFQRHQEDYLEILNKYFPSKSISIKQLVNFFENYYRGFKFNYRYSGQDLFGGVSSTIDKEPINKFVNKLLDLGLPINMNEQIEKEIIIKNHKIIKNLIEYCKINDELKLNEGEYQGKKVQLNKPTKGDVKKYKVYVKNPKTGKVVKVNFGDKNMEIKRDNPERKKSFRARHKCSEKKDKTKAGYWSCKFWGNKKVSALLENKMDSISPSTIISDLEKLKPLFIKAAQKVYDEWEQNDEGYDEHFGYGGICDEIASEITHIISSKTNYSCFTHYDEYEFHTSTYVYHCYEEEIDEDEFQKNAYLISVDIPYWIYEHGAAYTWTKKQGVTFSPDMVEIKNVSSYAEGFVDFENCEPI